MKSTMKRCLAFAMVLAMLLSVCALPVLAADPVVAAPCEHAEVEGAVVVEHVQAKDEGEWSYDVCVCTVCNAKWVENAEYHAVHEFETKVVNDATYPEYIMENVGTEEEPVWQHAMENYFREFIGFDDETGEEMWEDHWQKAAEDKCYEWSNEVCKVCGYENVEERVRTGRYLTHAIQNKPDENACCVETVVTPATCMAPGVAKFECTKWHETNLNERVDLTILPQLPHAYTLGDYTAAEGENAATVKVECANGCGGFVAEFVAEVPAHDNCEGNVVEISRDADCVVYGAKAYKCDTCDYRYAVDYEAATGHNADGEFVYPTHPCTEDGYAVKYCTNCVKTPVETEGDVEGLWNSDPSSVWFKPDANGNCGVSFQPEKVSDKTGHYYYLPLEEGQEEPVKEIIDPTKHYVGVECEGCGESFDHQWVEKATPATCTEDGAEWRECQDPACGLKEIIKVLDKTGHDYELKGEKPTLVKDGWHVSVCKKCGHEKDYGVDEAANDIAFKATVANKYGSDAVIVNKSWIAYTIRLDADNITDAYSLALTVNFDANVFEYCGYDLGEDGVNAFGVYVADNRGATTVGVKGNVVTINAYSANYVDGMIAPVVLNGDQELVTLYFAVKSHAFNEISTNSTTADLSIASCNAMKIDGETSYKTVVDKTGENPSVEEVTIQKLGDGDGDGKITVKDQFMINALIASGMTEGAPLYHAWADINQDGIVCFEDLYIINQYLNTSFNYDDFVGEKKPAELV